VNFFGLKHSNLPTFKLSYGLSLLLFPLLTFFPFTLLAANLTSKPQFLFIPWDGLNRTYTLYRPANLNPAVKHPLVLCLHGGTGTGSGMQKLTFDRFNELADRDGWMVVYPDGIGKNWNDGRKIDDQAHGKNLDDVGFLSHLIDLCIQQNGVDPKRVYVTGISNGALMTCRLACELSDKIAAGAPVAGSMPANLPASCSPKHPVSMLFINGDKDPLVPFQGGTAHFFRRKRGEVIAPAQAAADWAVLDGCKEAPVTQALPVKDAKDPTRVDRIAYPLSSNGSEVFLFVIHGGGHTWPSGWKYLGEWAVGKVSRQLDACDLIWDFFKRHSR
jgi:polyhydroxybutyrate depolymerase